MLWKIFSTSSALLWGAILIYWISGGPISPITACCAAFLSVLFWIKESLR